MNEELKKMLDSIKAKKQEVKDLCKAGKLDDAAKAKEELKDLQAQFDLLYDLDADNLDDMKNKAAAGSAKKVLNKTKNITDAFVNALKAATGKTTLSEENKEILNSMAEGKDEDGGLTVPKDIRTAVKELRRSEDALENLVNVERVTTESGSRNIEKNADQTPFENVDEAAEFPDAPTPKFEKIEYKVKKKGGILKITQELLDDTAENIIGYLKKWIAKKSKTTRNMMIVKKIKEITDGEEVAVDGLDDLKMIFNVLLDPAIALTAGVLTNQDGYNWLDTLKDKDGRYILQPDPAKPTNTLLFGKYPIKTVSNKIMPSTDNSGDTVVPIVCGDLKEAITIFDRETLTVDISNIAGDLWKTDQTGIKVRERLDIQSVDEEAIIMAQHTIKAVGDVSLTKLDDTKSYTQEELEGMTKAGILALSTQFGYAMTTTEANSKAEIIADFMAQQGE